MGVASVIPKLQTNSGAATHINIVVVFFLILSLSRSLSLFTAEFSIWTREAGAGGLSIAVEGPSKAEISFEDRKDGSCGVSYIVKEPGNRRPRGRLLVLVFISTQACVLPPPVSAVVSLLISPSVPCPPPGDYEVSIKFNNEHIPDSPFIVPIATLSDEARRLTFTSLQVRAPAHLLLPPRRVCQAQTRLCHTRKLAAAKGRD